MMNDTEDADKKSAIGKFITYIEDEKRAYL
jgi:hypothetical protein